jgi:hypothetical protein
MSQFTITIQCEADPQDRVIEDLVTAINLIAVHFVDNVSVDLEAVQ